MQRPFASGRPELSAMTPPCGSNAVGFPAASSRLLKIHSNSGVLQNVPRPVGSVTVNPCATSTS